MSPRPRLHGLQVGIATYLMSHLQRQGTELVRSLFDCTRFWEAFRKDPLSRQEWIAAVRLGPTLKQDFYTILSERDWTGEVERLLAEDAPLQAVFA